MHENFLDVLKKGAKFRDVSLIAEIAPFAKLAITHTEYTNCDEYHVEGFCSITWANKFG